MAAPGQKQAVGGDNSVNSASDSAKLGDKEFHIIGPATY